MKRRYTAFLAVASGGAIELFGALFGEGVRGHGALFGLAGQSTLDEATVLGFMLGAATIVLAVVVMFRRDARLLAGAVAVVGIVGTLVAGQLFGAGALIACVGAVLAARLDRTVPVV